MRRVLAWSGGSGTVRRGVASLGPVWSGRACWGKAVAVGRVMVRSGKYVRAGRFRYGPFRLVTVRRLRRGIARRGWVWLGSARRSGSGVACSGVARSGVEWLGEAVEARYGGVRYGLAKHGQARRSG